MTIDQAMKIIEQNLSFYIKPVPPALLKRLKNIVISTKTIVKPEYIAANQRPEKPDLQSEWQKICKEYGVDPEHAMKGRSHFHIGIRCHFVRYIYIEYERSVITAAEVGRFLNRAHHMIIYYRDYAKVKCLLPPLTISRWHKFYKKAKVFDSKD